MQVDKIQGSLYKKVCSFENLYQAFLKAGRRKGSNQEALKFEYDLEKRLFCLKESLEGLTYQPRPLREVKVCEDRRKRFVVPAFSDRVVQQALLSVISPVFEKGFIFDSYSFRPGKGTHFALRRFDEFKRKVSPRRFPNAGFILKADIKDYYPSIDRSILVRLIREKIADEGIIWLLEKFINLKTKDKGISIGNPLSQLFANIYLNELDYFIKQALREKFYLRYADDFVVLNRRLKPLLKTKQRIKGFLKARLHLELNPHKTRIVFTNSGVDLLGYRIFYFHRLIRKRNLGAFKTKLKTWQEDRREGRLSTAKLGEKIRGWVEYARYANSYKLRKRLLCRKFTTVGVRAIKKEITSPHSFLPHNYQGRVDYKDFENFLDDYYHGRTQEENLAGWSC